MEGRHEGAKYNLATMCPQCDDSMDFTMGGEHSKTKNKWTKGSGNHSHDGKGWSTES